MDDKLTTDYIISRLRNPYGLKESDMKKVRLSAADEIEHWKNAYKNMSAFAVENGLDINTCN